MAAHGWGGGFGVSGNDRHIRVLAGAAGKRPPFTNGHHANRAAARGRDANRYGKHPGCNSRSRPTEVEGTSEENRRGHSCRPNAVEKRGKIPGRYAAGQTYDRKGFEDPPVCRCGYTKAIVTSE